MVRFDPGDPEDMRHAVRELFADPPPRDRVRGPGPTREDYLRWNSMVGKPSTGTLSGEILTDPDGTPVGVGPSTEITSEFGGVGVTRAELARVGLTPEAVPDLAIAPNYQGGTTDE